MPKPKKSKSKPKKTNPKKGGDDLSCQALEDRKIKNNNKAIEINNAGRPRVGGDLAKADIDKVPSEQLLPEGRDHWRKQQQELLRLKADVERDKARLAQECPN